MKYLHTMVRVTDIDASLDFYCDKLGLEELRRIDNDAGRFTLVFLAAPGDSEAQVELTHNWDPEQLEGGRNFGHLAYHVEDIYGVCQRLMDGGVTINRPAAGRPHGVRALAGQHLHRNPAARRAAAEGRALGLDAECGGVVGDGSHQTAFVGDGPVPSRAPGSRVGLWREGILPSLARR